MTGWVVMTPPRRTRWWDPTDVVNAVWSTATLLPPVSTGAAAAYRTMFMTARRAVLGRTITVRLATGAVRFRVAKVDSHLDARRLMLGQPDDVAVECVDITWRGNVFDRATVVLRNLRPLPGAPPVVVAGPVTLTVQIGSAALAEVLHESTHGLSGYVDDAGAPWVFLRGHPRWGRLEVDITLATDEDEPDAAGAVLVLRPRAWRLGNTRWPLPRRVPPRRLPVTDWLPPGLRLTAIEFGPTQVRVHAEMPHWRAPIPWPWFPFA